MKKLLCILLAATMLLAMTACGTENGGGKNRDEDTTDRDDAQRGNQVGDLCYGANLTEISENGMAISTFDPTELGKITVINFWAYWCPPCVGELPHFEEVAEEYADEVAVVAVHCDNLQKGQEFIGENHPNSAIRFAADREDEKDPYAYYTALGGSGSIPYTVIIDADGIIRYKFTGAITYEALVDAIEDCR